MGGARWICSAVDIIGAAEGYGFDVLRCFVAGAPTEAQRRLTEAAAAVTNAMVQACVPGATGRQIYATDQRRAEGLGYLEVVVTPEGPVVLTVTPRTL